MKSSYQKLKDKILAKDREIQSMREDIYAILYDTKDAAKIRKKWDHYFDFYLKELYYLGQNYE